MCMKLISSVEYICYVNTKKVLTLLALSHIHVLLISVIYTQIFKNV